MVIKGRNIYFILLANIILGGLLLTWLDGKSFAEGQYLALITALTVGYGDLAPVRADMGNCTRREVPVS